MSTHEHDHQPAYVDFTKMADARPPLAIWSANQAIETTRPWLSKPVDQIDVLDVGSGYGHTTLELARRCASAVGIEPARTLYESAQRLVAEGVDAQLSFRCEGIDDLLDKDAYDLVVLDNVYEHLPDHDNAIRVISDCLRTGGVVYLLVPNRLWPIEAHYRLPFLSYLPLHWANKYLRWSGRGTDYTDASYAPSVRSLRRVLSAHPELSWRLVLPADPAGTKAGTPIHYRVGMSMLRRFPSFWWISKALLVVAVKDSGKSGVGAD